MKRFHGVRAEKAHEDSLILSIEVIEEFWGPYYQRFRGGVCEINQHAAS
jgi:hypothetical protein